jgi:hypothetical protein
VLPLVVLLVPEAPLPVSVVPEVALSVPVLGVPLLVPVLGVPLLVPVLEVPLPVSVLEVLLLVPVLEVLLVSVPVVASLLPGLLFDATVLSSPPPQAVRAKAQTMVAVSVVMVFMVNLCYIRVTI